MVTKRDPSPRTKRAVKPKKADAHVAPDRRPVENGDNSPLNRFLQQALEDSRARPRRTYRKPLGQMIAELTKDIPREALDRLPEDGAINHDHYIYGTPKQYK